MSLVKVKCAFCGKEYFRPTGRINEAEKFGWKQYCSIECQSKSRVTGVEKLCGNLNCKNVVFRMLNQFKRSKSGFVFCSQSCAAIFNNKKCLKGHAKIKPKLKTCVQCGKQFKKNTGNKKYCSFYCRRKAGQRTPEELIKIIKETAKRIGRVPTRRELNSINDSCRKIFGSWNNTIRITGFIPNRSHDDRMYKRANAKALDGHLCDSISELLIDNWFYRNKILHKRNVIYPGTNHRADWQMVFKNQKIFVEYFGLANDSPRYDRSIKEKEMLCKEKNISLIAIYPKDLYPKNYLEDNLKKKFRDFIPS